MADALTEDYKNINVITRPIEDIGIVILDNKQITITSGVLEDKMNAFVTSYLLHYH